MYVTQVMLWPSHLALGPCLDYNLVTLYITFARIPVCKISDIVCL